MKIWKAFPLLFLYFESPRNADFGKQFAGLLYGLNTQKRSTFAWLVNSK